MDRAKEIERIYEAARKAREFISILSPESINRSGKASLMRDLTNEFLVRSRQNPDNKGQNR